ncbi:hypothetical protein GCM10028857_18160 [Salinarchaeum chitinilyticum]
MSVNRALFGAMLREEWRLHVRLFGGWRFAAFPVVVATLSASAVAALAWAGVDVAVAIAGLHALVFAFGLQTGSMGLVAQDALERVLGEISLLLSTWHHLPLSRSKMIAAFLLRDLVYYTGLIFLPLAVAFVPAGMLYDDALLAAAPKLAVSLPATFALGLATTTAIIALVQRGVSGKLLAVGVLAAVGAGIWSGLPIAAASPYGLYADPSLLAVAGTTIGIAVTATVGFTGLGRSDPRPARTREPALGALADRIGDDRGLVARSLLELSRSAGGLGTVAFSATVLLAVAGGVVALVSRIGGVDPQAGLTFGPLLGLSAFTSYNWLTTAADAPSYRRFPLSIGDVIAAKRRALALVGLPVGVAALLVALVWLGTTPTDAALGVLLFVGVHQYVGGLTAVLAGLQPNEFLFDTLLFTAFGAAVLVPVAPLLVVGLVVPSPGAALLAGVAVTAIALGAIGTVLGRRAGPRWEARYRSGAVN